MTKELMTWMTISITTFITTSLTTSIPFSGSPLISNVTSELFPINKTFLVVEQTDFRKDKNYIQYYILLTNFIFMGIIPSIIMIIFNVLVVRAVNEANQRRARMTRRQQRNITVTSMLVIIQDLNA